MSKMKQHKLYEIKHRVGKDWGKKNITGLWDNLKLNNICLIGFPELEN